MEFKDTPDLNMKINPLTSTAGYENTAARSKYAFTYNSLLNLMLPKTRQSISNNETASFLRTESIFSQTKTKAVKLL